MLSELGWESLERMVLFTKEVRPGEVMVPTEHILQINQSGAKGPYKQIRTNTDTYNRQSFFPGLLRTVHKADKLTCVCTLAVSVSAQKQVLNNVNLLHAHANHSLEVLYTSPIGGLF